ncbi:hypothetical protein SFR_6356 [Streptomyces sp. FR-008]|nr:hypothetical protein SFR_6356 [Streptomyces sp. FR-008]
MESRAGGGRSVRTLTSPTVKTGVRAGEALRSG